MGSVTSEEGSDHESKGFEIYSPSADVSESESLSSFSRTVDLRLEMWNSSFPATEKAQKMESDEPGIDLMKQRFAKLLLGEDMSGGGKGVCTGLAISNAITNLSATIFGKLWTLGPLPPQKKAMWSREMEWLLCVSDSIVELVPTIQQFPGGGTFEVMVPHPRADLYLNLPALKKLDAMLLTILDGFKGSEFGYVEKGIVLDDPDEFDVYGLSSDSGGRPSFQQEDKWWLPCPKVPPNGLSENTRMRLEQCRDCTNQILKAAMAINSIVLSEMEIPGAYIENLPKNGKSCLGDVIYRHMTARNFNPESIIDCLDLSTDHRAVETAGMIEAAAHVWRYKEHKKCLNNTKAKNKSWGGKAKGHVFNTNKNRILAERAETLLVYLRCRYPGLSQTALDMSKIQYNTDVGKAILESYSRVLESLAFNVMARMDDLLYVDDATKRCVEAENMSFSGARGGLAGFPIQKCMSPSPFSIPQPPYSSACNIRSLRNAFSSTTDCSTKCDEGMKVDEERKLCYLSRCEKVRENASLNETDLVSASLR